MLVLLGAGLRLWQYGAGASLWADEANMALNLIGRPLAALFTPLDHRQVAPAGWLVLEKAAIALVGDGERALRLVPCLSSLAALLLFWRLAGRLLQGHAVPLAVGLFALGIPFVALAAQVKPYAGDIAAACAVLLVALEVAERGFSGRRLLGLAVTGALAVWVSLPAMLVLGGAGAVLGLRALRAGDPAARGRLAAAVLAWSASAACVLWLARRGVSAEARAYLAHFWAGSFWVVPPRGVSDVAWPLVRLSSVFGGGGLRYPLPGLFMALAVIGAATYGRRRPVALALLLAPVGVTLAASAWGLYPFSARVLLFLYPACLLLVAAGAQWLGTLPGRAGRWLGGVAGAATALLAILALARYPPPYTPEHLEPVLAAVARERQTGDHVYVYYGGEKAFRYYAPRYGLRPADYVMGGCWRDDPRAYLRELDALRGARRVWVIVTHALADLDEDTLILGYLDRIGVRRRAHRQAPRARAGRAAGAAAYLYDLSDPTRLAAVSAATHPVPVRDGPPLAWSC